MVGFLSQTRNNKTFYFQLTVCGLIQSLKSLQAGSLKFAPDGLSLLFKLLDSNITAIYNKVCRNGLAHLVFQIHRPVCKESAPINHHELKKNSHIPIKTSGRNHCPIDKDTNKCKASLEFLQKAHIFGRQPVLFHMLYFF